MNKLWKIIDLAVEVYEKIRDITKRKKPDTSSSNSRNLESK